MIYRLLILIKKSLLLIISIFSDILKKLKKWKVFVWKWHTNGLKNYF